MQDSALLKAFAGERTERPPVWFMRQAGRFLPEYRELRSKHRMLDVIKNPELASEVTLQPLRRFNLDAAIIFADILNPLIGMGIELDFVAGEGPRIFNPVQSAADVERLIVPSAEENVGYTLEAIKLTVSELKPRGVPLLGFAGAPFTLSCYLIEGETNQKYNNVKSFMLKEPRVWHQLQEKLSVMLTEYLTAQVEAGAAAVQLFDSWLGNLGPAEYRMFVEPYLKRIISETQERTGAPVIFFATGAAGLYPLFRELGADVYGVDWRVSLRQADQLLGGGCVLQGNLDPSVLAGPRGYLEDQVAAVLEDGRSLRGHVFNVGHGILPHTPIENVERVLELVKG